MLKRDDLFLKNIASFQIFLIIFSVFSFAFLIGESSRVEGQEGEKRTIDYMFSSFRGPDSASIKQAPGPEAPAPKAITPSPTGVVTGSPVTVYADRGFTINGKAFNSGEIIYKYSSDGNFHVQQGSTNVIATGKEVDNAVRNSGVKLTPNAGGPPNLPEKTPEPFKDSLTGLTGSLGYLVQGLQTALLVVGAVQLVGKLAGWDKSLTDTLSIAAGAGVMTTAGLKALFPTNAVTGTGVFADGPLGMSYTGWIGVGVAIAIFVIMYKKESKEIYNFQCRPFEAPIGGKDCEKCNGDNFRPCSEYRCRALGQACELVNVGSKEEKCIWVNPNDVLSPTITPWTTPLTENHRYTNHDTRPASLGTKIVKNGATNGCLQAFTPLTFGIITNEPAQCKIDLEHKKTFDEMQYFFGNTNLYLYNHTQQFSLPSPSSINAEVPELQANGKYDFFVRCRDKNGNENVDEFAIQLCVDSSPDTTAPVIVDTSIPSESYVKFKTQGVPVQFYVNEPATCKWSTQDKSYDVMENAMICSTSLTQINARELYTCATNLTGIVDRKENNFFVRCKDQPSKPEEDRNVNVASYKYNLRGSQPLNIIFAGPNGTVTGNTNTVPVNLKVVTDDGASEGIAICAFSSTGLPNSFIPMFETRAVEHKQRLDLTTGNYNYKIRCADFGGNSVEAEIRFNVLVDTVAPLVTRAYRDSSNEALKIVTNEDATCVYSLNSCNFNFNEGIEFEYISTSNKKSHYAKWKPNSIYYMKCRDVFENEPGPNTCSLVASATNLK